MRAAALVAAALLLAGCRAQTPPSSDFLAKRKEALEAAVPSTDAGPRTSFVVVVDYPQKEGTTTLVARRDGSATVLRSPGTAFEISAGSEMGEVVRAMVQSTDELTTSARDRNEDLPPVGRVRFFIRSPVGNDVTEADALQLEGGGHPYSPLFHDAMRLMAEAAPAR